MTWLVIIEATWPNKPDKYSNCILCDSEHKAAKWGPENFEEQCNTWAHANSNSLAMIDINLYLKEDGMLGSDIEWAQNFHWDNTKPKMKCINNPEFNQT